jgi:hypothetical protein
VTSGIERRCASRRNYRLRGPLVCTECRTVHTGNAEGWRGYRADIPYEDELPRIGFYCADCAAKEFGPVHASG